ncbi:MAG: hypothetical protein JO207_03295 [Verrucomicrobia bacterium]|nr:hypothetical protein [Verrucomicrobiota bacterium]
MRSSGVRSSGVQEVQELQELQEFRRCRSSGGAGVQELQEFRRQEGRSQEPRVTGAQKINLVTPGFPICREILDSCTPELLTPEPPDS